MRVCPPDMTMTSSSGHPTSASPRGSSKSLLKAGGMSAKQRRSSTLTTTQLQQHAHRRPPAQVFANIFDYIDRLVAIVRPRALIYMAIDGVAPRAKMNQQRSRRFRASQDREEQARVEAELRSDFAKQGIHVAAKDDGNTFDSNVITPGTPFMERLAMVLQWCGAAL
jgi:5'-3' exonuclease